MKNRISHEDLKIFCDMFFENEGKINVIHNSFYDLELGEAMNERRLTRVGELPNLLITPGSKSVESFHGYESILEFGKSKRNDHLYKYSMRYITVNGVVRWVYPSRRLKTVLNFYHASTKRAKLLKTGLRVLDLMRLDWLISKPLTIHTDQKECFPRSMNGNGSFDEFSIFMGTPGIERTVLIASYKDEVCQHFRKFGLTNLACQNVENEGHFLYRLQQREWQSFQAPGLLSRSERGIVQSRLHTRRPRITNQFTRFHAAAILEIADSSRSLQRFDSSTFGERILDDAAFISRSATPLSKLERKLLEVVEQTPDDLYFTSTLCHGDFTPWNMFMGNEKLYVYDWEAAMDFAPALYDLFHYHFQTGIFLKKWSFERIYSEIKFSIESNLDIRKNVDRYSIDIKTYLRLYLMHVVARKSALSKVQAEVSCSQLDHRNMVWETALNYLAPSEVSNRSEFIEKFHVLLREHRHAFMKFDAVRLSTIPDGSDLDIAIDKKSLKALLMFCRRSKNVARMRYARKSFMTTIDLFFSDGGFLSIDLIYDFKRRAFRFMSVKKLLENTEVNEYGVRVPKLQYDLEYALLFYTLNGARLPAKYIEFFNAKSTGQKGQALAFFNFKYQVDCSDFNALLHSKEEVRAAFLRRLKVERRSRPILQLLHLGNYLIDTLTDKASRRGFIISFSGVDGVGKTTVIGGVQKRLGEKYRKEVVLLRHRPKVLPMLSTLKYGSKRKAEANAECSNPNLVTPKTKLSSYLRFGYYYLDYIIGQFYVHVRYVMAGKIVLYDRFYFDMINHPERNNMVVHPRFARWLYQPILKPALNVYLNASSEQIFYRKRELSIREIDDLSRKYVSLFHELAKKNGKSMYVLHRNEDVDQTVQEILLDVQQIA